MNMEKTQSGINDVDFSSVNTFEKNWRKQIINACQKAGYDPSDVVIEGPSWDPYGCQIVTIEIFSRSPQDFLFSRRFVLVDSQLQDDEDDDEDEETAS